NLLAYETLKETSCQSQISLFFSISIAKAPATPCSRLRPRPSSWRSPRRRRAPASPRSSPCRAEAVKAIEAWIKLARIAPGDAVLRSVTKGGKIGDRLHAQSVAHIVKARIAEHYRSLGVPVGKAEEEAGRFSGHSLQVGFAVSAAEAGADVRAIASS